MPCTLATAVQPPLLLGERTSRPDPEGKADKHQCVPQAPRMRGAGGSLARCPPSPNGHCWLEAGAQVRLGMGGCQPGQLQCCSRHRRQLCPRAACKGQPPYKFRLCAGWLLLVFSSVHGDRGTHTAQTHHSPHQRRQEGLTFPGRKKATGPLGQSQHRPRMPPKGTPPLLTFD